MATEDGEDGFDARHGAGKDSQRGLARLQAGDVVGCHPLEEVRPVPAPQTQDAEMGPRLQCYAGRQRLVFTVIH